MKIVVTIFQEEKNPTTNQTKPLDYYFWRKIGNKNIL